MTLYNFIITKVSKLLLFFGFLDLQRLYQYLTVVTTDSQTSNARSATFCPTYLIKFNWKFT